MALSTAEQWKALELTREALIQEDDDLNRPLPTYLVDVLLPRVGISIEYVSFQACALMPNTRTCTVHYMTGSRSVIERIRDLRKEGKLDELRLFTLEFQKMVGTLEAVVWNAVLYNNEAVVPLDVNLCVCRDIEQFRQYVYIALGYSRSTFLDDSDNRHVDKLGPVETLHRSWMEHNFARWDTSSDLTSRYAALRALVAFPSEAQDIVVTMREVAPVSQESKALYDKINTIVKAEYEAAYRANYPPADSTTRTWGLGAIAFFGACRGDRWVWSKALAEANQWFNWQENTPLVSVAYDDAHFPEAVYALSRAVFRGNVLSLVQFRKHLTSKLQDPTVGGGKRIYSRVTSVKVEFENAAEAAPAKSYVNKIGSSEHFFAALANNFWIDEDFDDLDINSKPAVSKVVVGLASKLSFETWGPDVENFTIESLQFEDNEEKKKSTLKSRHTFDAATPQYVVLYSERDELWNAFKTSREGDEALRKAVATAVKSRTSIAKTPRDPVAIIAACGDGSELPPPPIQEEGDEGDEGDVFDNALGRYVYERGESTYPRLLEEVYDTILNTISRDDRTISAKVHTVERIVSYLIQAVFNVMTAKVLKMTLNGFETIGLFRAWEHASALDQEYWMGFTDVPYGNLTYMGLPSKINGEIEEELKNIIKQYIATITNRDREPPTESELSTLVNKVVKIGTSIACFDTIDRNVCLIDIQRPMRPEVSDLTKPSANPTVYTDQVQRKRDELKATVVNKAKEMLDAKIEKLDAEMKALKEKQQALDKTYKGAKSAVASADEALKASLKAVQDLVAKVKQEKQEKQKQQEEEGAVSS